MEIINTKRFTKEVAKTPTHVQLAVRKVIDKLIIADSLETSDVDYTFMEGQKKDENFFRIRIGQWRIGAELVEPDIILLRVLPRGTIYKHFPPK